eukprot:TRINITY_DN285_c1_g1_i1.p1 TRINITY_DN285_c1_g1~~TRINITY_DN285_c1_g1_i1.p1  ORF type:complete len:290 (-),score=155.29 TRINITY_DN285_c1_g1_i1:164-1033(-)
MEKKEKKELSQIFSEAYSSALRGGIPGAAAMGIQVLSLMWLRTTMNYQYRYGTTTLIAIKTLYSQGGIIRFYRGLLPALIQGPLSRFGDTAANSGILALLSNFESTSNLPIVAKTACASFAAGIFRIVLTPVDTVKTIMQVEGKNGLPALWTKFKAGGPPVFFHGALATAGATMVGHYPWFFTYNYLNANLPNYDLMHKKLLRSAFIGFTASVISDTCSNSIRVIKTTKQTHTTPISYPDAVKKIVSVDGYIGLFGRGLKTRIITNGLQGLLFSVLWRLLEDQYVKHTK